MEGGPVGGEHVEVDEGELRQKRVAERGGDGDVGLEDGLQFVAHISSTTFISTGLLCLLHSQRP